MRYSVLVLVLGTFMPTMAIPVTSGVTTSANELDVTDATKKDDSHPEAGSDTMALTGGTVQVIPSAEGPHVLQSLLPCPHVSPLPPVSLSC